MLAILLSTFLFTAPLAVQSSIEIVRKCHLDTSDGRASFLINELMPYVQTAESLNREISETSAAIEALSPETDSAQILHLSGQVAQKMDVMLKMVPVLQTVLTIHTDLEQLGAILNKQDPFTSSEQEVVDRIASLCDIVYSCR